MLSSISLSVVFVCDKEEVSAPYSRCMNDVLFLSRLQFALNIGVHILFPSVTVGLSWILVFFRYRYIRTANAKWMQAYSFWLKIFGITFTLGVITGVTMPFQFATNWPRYMEIVGNIAGPILAYEVLTAFFLEGTFIGVILFGQKHLSNRFHTFCAFLVALGATISSFIILSLASWMVTPDGFEMRDGMAHALLWWEIVFNPSSLYRFAHMMIASAVTAAFLMGGVSAYRQLRGDTSLDVQVSLRTGIYTAAIFSFAQIIVGDLHGWNTNKHQAQTMAVAEAVWHKQRGAPLVLFAIPDSETQTNQCEISIPKLGSFLMTHHFDGEVRGISSFADHPPVLPVFFSFRIMVYLGILMACVSAISSWLLKRKNSLSPTMCKILVLFTFSGWIATLAGWCVTEMGRQPWLVQGVLKTADAVTHTGSGMVKSTFVLYLIGYMILVPLYILTIFYLARKQTEINHYHHQPQQLHH